MTETSIRWPKGAPGSDEAIEHGCTCPVLDNAQGRTTSDITEEAARLFRPIADELRKWKDPSGEQLVDDMRIARFFTRMLFCMFATDIGLLPAETFSAILREYQHDAPGFREAIRDFWKNMQAGGRFGAKIVPHFNGELFEDDDVPEEVTGQEIRALAKLDAMNWADVEPAIFGTLFERLLDSKSRAKLGAHYTSREDIELLVEPVLMAPLRRKWTEVREAAAAAMEQAELHGATPETVRERLREKVAPFLDEVASIQVLDPACGSGNFLYVSLALLKALEKEAIAFAELYGVDFTPRVHPGQLHGIEINPYAHEVASIVIWIGYLQWKHRNGLDLQAEKPILQKLRQVELKDALVDASDPAHPREAQWPEADVIVGNPPFLGGKRLRTELGNDYVETMFGVFDGRVRRESDLCCYWFEKARAQIVGGKLKRVGLLATQAIRRGASRDVLERIRSQGAIFFAESDRPWTLDGAAVRIAMVGFDGGSEQLRHLDGRPVEGINADLTHQVDVTAAPRLEENAGISFMGDTKVGPFEVSAETARGMLNSPNPDGRSNADVVRPWINGLDVTHRARNLWIIDFPPGTGETEAALYEEPFEYITRLVRPFRATAKSGDATGVKWWIHQRPRPEMRSAIAPLWRFLVTVSVSKYRLFRWYGASVLPDHKLFVFARDDDYFFGVLQSRIHEVWSLANKSVHGDGSDGGRPVYNNTTCFETFPLPWPPGTEPEDDPRYLAIAEAAKKLNELREGWLNPAPVDGLPLAESELKKRTLTNLYNARPTWLQNAHRALDEAVFAAYGWPPDLGEQEILGRLLALNVAKQEGLPPCASCGFWNGRHGDGCKLRALAELVGEERRE